jgi:mRNA (2'-O-methyladenosine-N6-)-methyltransferase
VCPRATACSDEQCTLVHFKLRVLPQTESALGDCSYLNACHHLDVCRYKHYRPATPTEEEAERRELERKSKERAKPLGEKLYPPQWIDCDLRKLDVAVLGKFDVIMADPPWDSEQTPD